ncbi:hypothetical protein TrCOL_g5802 [Triparma columacea]|uniref:SLC41A/MgtE integral membrane domain-containing protein n=1 Tax=Triparma columacea TaxID=722753 RepID=A0A9W7G7Y7_9STRA|nr:hypothetical protein TrCOL_g5802 [Triparma columacea]
MVPLHTKVFIVLAALCHATQSFVPHFRCLPTMQVAHRRLNTKKKAEGAETEDALSLISAENSRLRKVLFDRGIKIGDRGDMVAEGEEFVGGESLWCDDDDGDEVCVIDNTSFDDNIKERGRWLVGLLVLQSCSSFILSANEALLQKHPSIIYFLTMLVGAGGNAGNQASVRVIRGLALGTLTSKNQGDFLRKELTTAFYLSLLLSVAGFARAVLFKVPGPETMAITIALFSIVFFSIIFGATLPLLLKSLGIDPAHSSTSIQVIMDILGVVFTVGISTLLLDSPWGHWIVERLVS